MYSDHPELLFCSFNLLFYFPLTSLRNLRLIPDTLHKLDMQRSDIYLKTGITFKHFVKVYLILGNENKSDLYFLLYNNLNAAKTACWSSEEKVDKSYIYVLILPLN